LEISPGLSVPGDVSDEMSTFNHAFKPQMNIDPSLCMLFQKEIARANEMMDSLSKVKTLLIGA
jgi:hypothetical protein